MTKKTKKQLNELAMIGGFVNVGGVNKLTPSYPKLADLVEDFYETRDKPKYNVREFVKEVEQYNQIGKMIRHENDIREVAQRLSRIAEIARDHALSQVDEDFDKITVNKNMKALGNAAKEFSKIAGDASTVQQRMESLYEDMGHILGRYYEIKELCDEDGEQEIESKLKESDGNYQVFFNSAMKKFGISSPDELDDEKKKKFFNYIDNNYQAKQESLRKKR